jgi:hypothetical protein
MKCHLRTCIGLPIALRLALATLAVSFLLVSTAPGQPAVAAPGDRVADRVLGQPDFTSNTPNNGGISASSLASPSGVAVDGSRNLFVADRGNNRVLEYNTPLTTDTVADRVFGQAGSFTTNDCNKGGVISASSICVPAQVAVDSSGNLFVADELNNRVLEYDSPLTTDTVADRVFGQAGSFTTNDCNKGGVISASSLCHPWGVAVDGAGNLYVADQGNSRVLEYDTPLTTNTVADRVFGQAGNFTTGDCNKGGVISASTLCGVGWVAVDDANNLYVSDRGNARVLEYDTPLTTNTVADRVFGQPDFTSHTCNNGGVSASTLCVPGGLAVDNAGNLYAPDAYTGGFNNRVLEYDTPLTTDTVADRVFGQPDFSSNTCNNGGLSASSLCDPAAAAVDAARNVYVADQSNARLLEYDASVAPPVGGIAQLPDVAGTSVDEAGVPADGSGWSAGGYAALAGGLAVVAAAIAVGGWYARRRWLR